MKILIKPSDIVKRCLWDMFVQYVVKSEEKAKGLLAEDKEFELGEHDALVIGLLNCIETDNLISKFNSHIMKHLTYKSLEHEGKLYVRKKGLEIMVDEFLGRFPEYWKFPLNYKVRYDKLVEYVAEVKAKISSIKVLTITVKNAPSEIIPASQIKKLLEFTNY